MWKATLASIRSHKRRLLSTSLAVLLGVAFLSGTLVLGETTRAGFSDAFTEANAGTDALVRSETEIETEGMGATGLLDQGLADQIATLDDVATVVPMVEAAGQIVGSDGDPIGGNGPPTLAGNWIEDPDLNPYRIDSGRAPQAADAAGGNGAQQRPGDQGPYEVVIDKGSAELGDLEVGDTTTVRVPQPIEVTVVGIATFGDANSIGGSTFAAFTFDAAQDLLMPQPGQITDIRVAAVDGVTQQQLVDQITPVLPDGVESITGTALTAEWEENLESDFLGFFETFLVVFAGIALVVATFSIYNTFSIVVAQRTRESALLRALGASRRQVLASVVAEAVVVGLVASGVGIVAGLGLASGLGALMDAIGMSLPSSSIGLNGGIVATSLIVGLVATVGAALVPAVKAARVKPLAALRDVAVDRSATSRWRALAGVVVAGGGIALTVAGAGGGSLSLTALGALVALVAMVLLGPIAARPVAGILGTPWARLRGMSGRLARRNAMRNPKRTASTALALMVGVTVVALFTVVAASLKQYIDDTTEDAFSGDLVIASNGFSGVGIDPALAGSVAELPEVDVATGLTSAPVSVDGDDNWASAADGPALGQIMDLRETDGSITDLTAGTVALSDTYAEDNGWTVGDTVPVSYADGAAQQLQVVAVFDAEDLFGEVLISQQDWAPHAVQAEDFAVFVDLANGVPIADGKAAVQGVADRYAAPDVQDREEYVESVAAEVDQMLAVIYVLLVLAIVIALMGIANTLALSVHERTRELGLLRAVGQSRRQIRTMVRGEATMVALFGTVGGLVLGGFLGWAMIAAMSESELGGQTPFALPVGQMAILLVAGAVAGIVAAVRPARRAARLDVLDAIATE
jgi:putative ABC transport system permease protein